MTKTLVAEVYRIHGSASVSIPGEVPLEEVIARFAREPSLRGMFLVDSKQRFAGMLTRIDLLRWAHLTLSHGRGRHELALSEFYRIVDARKAKDLASAHSKGLSVKESDSVQHALQKMLDNEEDVLPVVDNGGRVLGDLRLSEVLMSLIRQGRTSHAGNDI